MSRTNLLTQSGNRVVIEFDTTQVGLLQSFRPSDDYGLEAVGQIGDIHTVEHVPTRAMHTASFSRMVLIADKMRALGLIPENGDAVLLGLVFDVVIYSRDTNQALRKWVSASYGSGDIDISANRIVVSSGSLRFLDVKGTGL